MCVKEKTVYIGLETTGGFRHPLGIWNVSLQVRGTPYFTKAGGLVLALYIHIHVTASLVSLGPGTWQALRKFRNEFACLFEAFVPCATLSIVFSTTCFLTPC